MIKNILEMLKLVKDYENNEIIAIAKGKYQLVTTWKQGFEQIKRQLKWQLKK